GGGTVVLGVASNYGGPTTITAGTLRTAGADNAVPTTAGLVIRGGSLDLASHNQQVTTLAGVAGTVITNSVAATTSTLTINGAASSSYAGSIQNGAGTVSLVQAGSGTSTLSGASTYSGTTTISNGILVSSNSGALGTSTV